MKVIFLQLTENTFVELKREYTDEIRKSVIAFANTKGGTIFIGISNNGDIMDGKNKMKTGVASGKCGFTTIKKYKYEKANVLNG